MIASVRSPFRVLLVASVAVLALSACNRERAEETPAPAPAAEAEVTLAESGSQLGFENKTQHAEVSLVLPEAVKGQPDLHARLYAEEVRKLRQFSEGAVGARTEVEGEDTQPPYQKAVSFTPGGETGKLFSLRRVDFDYSGGAHPNTLLGGLLWDKALKRLIGPGELFRRGVDLTPLDQALCSAVNAARRARVPDAVTLNLGAADGGCPRAADTPFILAPGSTPGKAGGLIFLLSPYQVGPYAEGSYELAVPQSAFRSLLAPAYADEFAGQPVRAGDVTPQG